MEAPEYGCGRCPARWGGLGTAHCGGCHHTFTTVNAFDRHRAGGRCNPPAEVGLTPHDRGQYTAWGFTISDTDRARLAALKTAQETPT